LLAALLLAALAPAGYALAAGVTIGLGPSGPQPAAITVNWGDTVTFVNKDSSPHVVSSRTANFTSPTLNPGQSYEHIFNGTARKYSYDQGPGRSLNGTVDVRLSGTLSLAASRRTVVFGRPIHLSGTSSLGETPVDIQAREANQWKVVATLTPATDGTFRGDLVATIGNKYRAATAANQLHSGQVRVNVAPALAVRASASHLRSGSRLVVRATVKPGNSATFASLMLFNAKRFRWQTVATRPIAAGVAVFRWTVPRGRSLLRVSLSGRSTIRGFSPTMSKSILIIGAG
jgi:plastocyanin